MNILIYNIFESLILKTKTNTKVCTKISINVYLLSCKQFKCTSNETKTEITILNRVIKIEFISFYFVS